jgi:ABC-2 type transport system ATP-binding protein
MAPAIDVHDLVKIYPPRRLGVARARGRAVRAVDGLSFSVRPGQIFGLLGPNGAGKTTTLRVLTTLLRPTSGRASVAGFDVVERPLEVRRRIAVVVQENASELFLTVRDGLAAFGRFHGLGGAELRARIASVMDQFGLADEAGRKAMDLSGGFRRRIQVAKVFLVDTPVVFLDEFSTGMDPILKRATMMLLRQEAARGRTIVLTTQILSEAEELCDDILIINHGRAVARGDLHALKLLSHGVYEVALTFDRVPDGLEAELKLRQPIRLSVTPSVVEVALKEPETQVLELVTDLSRRARLLRVEIGGASLEDIFVELMEAGRTAGKEEL